MAVPADCVRLGQGVDEIELLTRCCNSHTPVTIYLSNGYRFRGVIVGWGDTMISVEHDGEVWYIYKHNISTIAPDKRL